MCANLVEPFSKSYSQYLEKATEVVHLPITDLDFTKTQNNLQEFIARHSCFYIYYFITLHDTETITIAVSVEFHELCFQKFNVSVLGLNYMRRLVRSFMQF
jgi:hypothetical protein